MYSMDLHQFLIMLIPVVVLVCHLYLHVYVQKYEESVCSIIYNNIYNMNDQKLEHMTNIHSLP